MSQVLLLARREFASYLRTLSGYLIIAGIVFIDAVLFNVWAISGAAMRSTDALHLFFFWSSGLTMACAVLLSMRLLAEERQTGTILLLFSSPIRDWQIVLGKFVAALGFLGVFFLFTLPMPLLIMVFGKISVGHLVSGYLGLLFVGAFGLAFGMFCSALTRVPFLAAILGLVVGVVLTVIWYGAKLTDQPLANIFTELAWYQHFTPFAQGLFHVKHTIYFVIGIYLWLFGATRVLEARRWR